MLQRLNRETTELLMQLDLPEAEEIESTNKSLAKQDNYSKAQTNQQAPAGKERSNSNTTRVPQFQGSEGYDQAMQNSYQQVERQQPVVAEPKVGRNDLCPCGSGKKYKQCHGK